VIFHTAEDRHLQNLYIFVAFFFYWNIFVAFGNCNLKLSNTSILLFVESMLTFRVLWYNSFWWCQNFKETSIEATIDHIWLWFFVIPRIVTRPQLLSRLLFKTC
jgi:hypothetical protein